MSKRFIVLIDEDFTKEQRNRLTQYFKGKFGYWHWIGNAWLLSTSRDSDTSTSIRDELRNILNKGLILVLDMSNNNWAAFGDKKKTEWFHKNWK
ncbi:hypothetical protein DPW01_01085 [Aggregatibacter aphrophilus]|uniref:hypothetical protein n=1 Tax=Aggregatibacter aphrophilus TaxID=732 RepID=UPI000DA3C824|nr:hypothetical protein [Aggregatibacter aphrophilus]RDE92892.1 hypothetical protein DPW01_01085 [Aggregatibacter aphrophilus]SQI98522.1 Uncharacterised protein [Aggregatibacter aphrophilus]